MIALKNLLSLTVFATLHLVAQAALGNSEVATILGVSEQDVGALLNTTDYSNLEVKTWTRIYDHVSDAEADSWEPANKIAFFETMKSLCRQDNNGTVVNVENEAEVEERDMDGSFADTELASRAIQPSHVTFPAHLDTARVWRATIAAIRQRMIAMRRQFLRARGWLNATLRCRNRSHASCLVCKTTSSGQLIGTELVCGAASLGAAAGSGGGLTPAAFLALTGCTTAAMAVYGSQIDGCVRG